MPLSLSLSLTLGNVRGGGVSYAEEAEALFARFTTPPTTARKGLINDLVVQLIDAGVWSKLDAFYVMAAADSQAARLNWIGDIFNLTPVSAPTFTVDRDYQGDGSTSYLSPGFNPATAVSPKFVRDSASLGVYSRTDANTQQPIGNSSCVIVPRSTADGVCRVNNSGTATTGAGGQSPTSIGFFNAIRSASNAERLRRNNTTIASSTAASSSVANDEITILKRSTTFSTLRVAAAWIGAAMSDVESDALNGAVSTYLQAVGAA